MDDRWEEIIAACHPDSPVRSPAWRWHRAEQLRHLGPRAWEQADDEWVTRAGSFLAWQAEQEAGSDAPVPDEFAGIAEARRLWAKGNEWDRCLIEARLLAGASHPDIAEKTGVSVAAVEAYAHLYYDIEPRRANTGYMIHVAIGPGVHSGEPMALPLVVKMMAFAGGPHVLDAVLATCAGEMKLSYLAAVWQVPKVARRTIKATQAAIASYRLPVNQSTAIPLLRLHLDWRQRQIKAAARERLSGPILDVDSRPSP
jgi:hypothetical protein